MFLDQDDFISLTFCICSGRNSATIEPPEKTVVIGANIISEKVLVLEFHSLKEEEKCELSWPVAAVQFV